MTIGGSIALILVGAILAFAVAWEPGVINISMIGIILMIGGAVGLVFGIYQMSARRRVVRRRPDAVEEPR